jgi:hypothetical protein
VALFGSKSGTRNRHDDRHHNTHARRTGVAKTIIGATTFTYQGEGAPDGMIAMQFNAIHYEVSLGFPGVDVVA